MPHPRRQSCQSRGRHDVGSYKSSLPVVVDGVGLSVEMAGCHSSGIHGSCWMQQTMQLQDVAVLCRLLFLVHTIRQQTGCLATEANVTRMRLSTCLSRLESRNIIVDFLSHNSLCNMRTCALCVLN